MTLASRPRAAHAEPSLFAPAGPDGEGPAEAGCGCGRVEWGGLKEVDRVLEKLVRSYERNPARVLDYCRQACDVRACAR
jgi:hypothetical protein